MQKKTQPGPSATVSPSVSEPCNQQADASERIQAAVRRNPRQMTLQLARDLGVPEVEVIRALPEDRAVELDASRWETLLRSLEALGLERVLVSNGRRRWRPSASSAASAPPASSSTCRPTPSTCTSAGRNGHAIAPFGCAFFDAHLDSAEARPARPVRPPGRAGCMDQRGCLRPGLGRLRPGRPAGTRSGRVPPPVATGPGDRTGVTTLQPGACQCYTNPSASQPTQRREAPDAHVAIRPKVLRCVGRMALA